ncbi:hypothetical protein HDV01_001730 [Terramyces sp. JEL0728]|nr:hypothetical protein HDV01_001730 [Terramyces sp. JEL0728]
MSDRYLNVQLNGVLSDINLTGINRFGAVQAKIKEKFPNALDKVDIPLIQLLDGQRKRISSMALVDSLPLDYFMEGGACLDIHIPILIDQPRRYEPLPEPVEQEQTQFAECLRFIQKPPFADSSAGAKRYFKVQVKPMLIAFLCLSGIFNILQIVYTTGLIELLFLTVVIAGFAAVTTENPTMLAYYTWVRLLFAIIELIFDFTKMIITPSTFQAGIFIGFVFKYVFVLMYLFTVIRFWNAISRVQADNEEESRPLVNPV